MDYIIKTTVLYLLKSLKISSVYFLQTIPICTRTLLLDHVFITIFMILVLIFLSM